jgi:predicted amidohydrolase
MSFRVSIAQQPLVWQDAAANRAHFARILAPLAGATDLVVLPELFTTGFTMKPAEFAEPADGPTRAWLQEQALVLDAAVGGSVAVNDHGCYYNRFMRDQTRCWDVPQRKRDGTLFRFPRRYRGHLQR